MPTASKPATSTSSKKSSSPSIPMFQKANVREFGGGRWEGGIATVVKGVGGPWKYPAKVGDPNPSNKHNLFAILTLRDEAGDEHAIPYMAGFFGATDPKESMFYNNAYPSKDGQMPAGPEGMELEELLELYSKLAAGELVLSEDEEQDYQGVSAVFRTNPDNPDRVPKLSKLDWIQLVQTVYGLPEFQSPEGTTFEGTTDFNMFDGYKFMWIWEPQKNKSKKMKEGGKTFEVLVPNQCFGKDEEWEAEQAEEEETPTPKLQSSKKATVKGKPAPPVEEEEDETEVDETEDEDVEESGEDELGDRVDAALLVTLQKIGHPAVKREFNATVAKMFKGPEQLEVLNNYLNNNKWMTSEDRSFTYADGKWSA